MNKISNKGWIVVIAGLGINLTLGLVYTWSIFKEYIASSIRNFDGRFNWDPADLNNPYAVCLLVWSFTMIFAGRVQDKFGPRFTAVIGGVLAGLGLILSSLSYSLSVWVLGFGILTGMGVGFSYASATPPAIKWFPPNKTGFITGMVVAGFGLASAYIAPLSEFLISNFGLSTAMLIFGLFLVLIICTLAQFLVNPPDNYKIENIILTDTNKTEAIIRDVSPIDMLKTGIFYKLWVMYCFGAGAGLMIIGNLASIAKQSLGKNAWIVVTLLALGNASGRVVAGIVSDKIGRMYTIAIVMMMQSFAMFSLFSVNNSSIYFIISLAIIIGFNYGTNLSLFPSTIKDYFGLKNFGINYGFLMTAWGCGGFLLPKISQIIIANTGSYNMAYILAGSLLIFSSLISFFTKA